MAKKSAILFGIILVIIGLLGFIANPVIGASGYFLADATHDIVYILIGVILLIAGGKGESAAATWLKVFGIVYILLFLDGLFQANLLGFIASNTAHAWLHLVIGIVLLIAGFMKSSSVIDTATV